MKPKQAYMALLVVATVLVIWYIMYLLPSFLSCPIENFQDPMIVMQRRCNPHGVGGYINAPKATNDTDGPDADPDDNTCPPT